MSDFKLNRNYENFIKNKKGKTKHNESIVHSDKGLFLKCVGVTKDQNNETTALVKITVKENEGKNTYSMRVKTLDSEDSFEDLSKAELTKKLSEKKYSHVTTHSLEYMKKDMSSLKK